MPFYAQRRHCMAVSLPMVYAQTKIEELHQEQRYLVQIPCQIIILPCLNFNFYILFFIFPPPPPHMEEENILQNDSLLLTRRSISFVCYAGTL